MQRTLVVIAVLVSTRVAHAQLAEHARDNPSGRAFVTETAETGSEGAVRAGVRFLGFGNQPWEADEPIVEAGVSRAMTDDITIGAAVLVAGNVGGSGHAKLVLGRGERAAVALVLGGYAVPTPNELVAGMTGALVATGCLDPRCRIVTSGGLHLVTSGLADGAVFAGGSLIGGGRRFAIVVEANAVIAGGERRPIDFGALFYGGVRVRARRFQIDAGLIMTTSRTNDYDGYQAPSIALSTEI